MWNNLVTERKTTMKLNKIFAKLMVVGAVIGACFSARAQGDFDFYALQKQIQLVAVSNYAVATGFATNTNTIDLSAKFIGSGYVDIFCNTNYGTNTVTITPQTSPDLTNWTSLANYALSVNSSTIYTNIFYSGSTTGALLSTNVEENPFSNVTPVASTAGFATPYPLPAPYTNSGSFTPAFNYYYRIGIQNIPDLPRYFRLLTVYSGTNILGAEFGGRRR
jgi:hypothetical protein